MPRHPRFAPEITAVMSRLTRRDTRIIGLLGDHNVLTTNQISRAFFDSLKRAQARLLVLYRLGVLERFRARPLSGSEQWHWVLSPFGARLHAATRDAPSPRPGRVTDTILRLASATTLAHTLGRNDFFVRILTHTRHRPDCGLTEWVSEQTTPITSGRSIRPDATATYIDNDRVVSFVFEFDRGSEPLSTLVAKVDRYRDATILSTPRAVLFALPSPARESHLHEHLAARHLPFRLATTHTAIADDPTAAVWRLRHRRERVRLIDIDA